MNFLNHFKSHIPEDHITFEEPVFTGEKLFMKAKIGDTVEDLIEKLKSLAICFPGKVLVGYHGNKEITFPSNFTEIDKEAFLGQLRENIATNQVPSVERESQQGMRIKVPVGLSLGNFFDQYIHDYIYAFPSNFSIEIHGNVVTFEYEDTKNMTRESFLLKFNGL